MTPTRLRTLAALALAAGAVAYLLAATSYASLPRLPGYAPVSLVLLVLVELGMAKVVRDRVHRRPGALLSRRARPLHPLQVARAAALAKASSAGGALLAGGYGGIFAWTAPRREEVAVYADDAVVAGVSLVASGALVAAALLLERACRVPGPPEDDAEAPQASA